MIRARSLNPQMPSGAARPVDPESPSQGKPRTLAEFGAPLGWNLKKPIVPPAPRYAPALQIQAAVDALTRSGAFKAMQTAAEATRTLESAGAFKMMRFAHAANRAGLFRRPKACGGPAHRPLTRHRERREHRRQRHVARATSSSDPPGEDDTDPDPVVERRPRHISGVLAEYLADIGARRAA
jgi:hypothetical protein